MSDPVIWKFALPQPIKWNGERWYQPRSRWYRFTRWFVWSGGWETHRRWALRERVKPEMLTPISVLGHRATLFHSGSWWAQVRTPRGWFTVSRDRCYLSHDGTPTSAHVFWWGAPAEAVMEARRTAERQGRRAA